MSNKQLVMAVFAEIAIVVLIAFFAWVGFNVWRVNRFTPEEREMIDNVERRYEMGVYDKKPVSKAVSASSEIDKCLTVVEERDDYANYEKVTDNGLYVVALTIYHEARGEGVRGMEAVASVIYNRSVERKMSVVDVCLQKDQFSCWKFHEVPKGDVVLKMDRAFEVCMNLAMHLIRGTFKPTLSANHYYNPKKCRPKWGRAMRCVKVIGNHRFGRV